MQFKTLFGFCFEFVLSCFQKRAVLKTKPEQNPNKTMIKLVFSFDVDKKQLGKVL